MAKESTTSFEEYDAGAGRRVQQARGVANRRVDAVIRKKRDALEGILEREARIAVRGSLRDILSGVRPAGVVVERFGSAVDDAIARETSASEAAEIDRRFKEDLYKNYFSLCMSDLVGCGMHLIRTSPDRMLPEDTQYDIYNRFVAELTTVYRNYGVLVSDVPDVVDVLNYYFLPRLAEQVGTVRSTVTKMGVNGYIGKKVAEKLLFLLFEASEKRKQPHPEAMQSSSCPEPVVDSAPVAEVTEEPVVEEDVAGYIVETFGVERSVAEEVAVGRSIEKVGLFHENLARMVGEENANLIISTNPAVLGYSNGKATKFISNLEDVLNSQREAQQLLSGEAEEFELNPENIPLFSDFDTLHSLKQRLFSRTREIKFPPKPAEGAIDVEEYKKKLLEKAGIDVEITCAFISGKNLHFIGEVYMPAEYFRKNTYLKIDAKKMMHFADVFDELVRRKVLKKKPKVNPVYRFNPNINDIEDTYLREYMRITLHAEQIVAQEGELTLNQEIVQELYPSNGNGAKKPL
jgi:hypothetical protein